MLSSENCLADILLTNNNSTMQTLEQQQEDQQQLIENILKASTTLSPLLFNCGFNYESILNLAPTDPISNTFPLLSPSLLLNVLTTPPSNFSSIDPSPSPPASSKFQSPLARLLSAESSCSSDSSSGQSTPTIRSAKSPNHIKRPMNAFMIWAKEERRKILKEGRGKGIDLHNSSISKMLGARWHTLTAEEKQPFVEQQIIQKKAHMEKYPDYVYRPKRGKHRMIDGKRVTTAEYSLIKTSEKMDEELERKNKRDKFLQNFLVQHVDLQGEPE